MSKQFRDFVTLQRGFDLPKTKMRGGPYPVVGSTSIIGYHNDWKVKPPGVVMGRSGSLGTIQFIEQPHWPHNTSLWVKDFKGNDPRFVYYRLQGFDFSRFNAGAGVPTLNRNHLDTLEVDVPPLPVQRRIADILSAYDDLIENNRRRIKILEDMARSLYREWFVDFRFPGHETVKLVNSNSPLGMIPEGWEIRRVADTFEVIGGGTPSRKIMEYWKDGAINWYTPTDLTSANCMFMDKSGTQITQLGLNESSAKLFPPYSVMMTSRATLGVISINTTKASTNQGFITCIPNSTFPLYTLYHWVKENTENFAALACGAIFREITKGVFKDIRVLIPDEELVNNFEDRIGAIGGQVLVLQRKNYNLRRTRDLLLPRLLSGQLDVSRVKQEDEIAA